MARGEEEEVSIFNMSFLDVFCCTVGALIFLLLILVLVTKDMVERATLDEVMGKLAEARVELDETEKARDSMREQVERIETQIKVASKDIRARDRKIEQLVAQIREPGASPADELLAELPRSAIGREGLAARARESQKQAQGQYVLGNLETKAIVCSGEGLYLGTSRKPIPLHHRDLAAVFSQFLRYHDPDQEGLWRTTWGEAGESYRKSRELERAGTADIRDGLVVRKDPDWRQAAGSVKTTVVDLDQDGDGFKEIRLEDTDGDGNLDTKRVNRDRDSFYEETYADYDPALAQWTQLFVDSDGDDQVDLLLRDTVPGDADYEVQHVLPNLATGHSTIQYEDRDNDGIWDIKFENTDLTDESWEKTYALFDKDHQRWGALMLDTDEDGQPDVLWRDTNMENDDWEEKLVDTSGDGVWDVRWQDLDARDNDWEARFTQPVPDTEIWKECEIDSDADGAFDAKLVDSDGDGEWDEEYRYDVEAGKWTQP